MTVFFGGSFSSIGGQPREDLAAICSSNDCEGAVGAGTPRVGANANNEVNTLALSGSTSTSAASSPRSAVGERHANGSPRSAPPTTAKAQSPRARHRVEPRTPARKSTRSRSPVRPSTSAGIHDDRRRRHGARTHRRDLRHGQLRRRQSKPGYATAWTPNANNTVDTIAISGSTVYVGGTFTTIGVERHANRIAAICATAKCEGEVEAGKATAWNPKRTPSSKRLPSLARPSTSAASSPKSGSAKPARLHRRDLTDSQLRRRRRSRQSHRVEPESQREVETRCRSPARPSTPAAPSRESAWAPRRGRLAAICATANCEGAVEAGQATAWARTPGRGQCASPPRLQPSTQAGEYTRWKPAIRRMSRRSRKPERSTFSSAPTMPTLMGITLNGESQTTDSTMTNFEVSDATASGAGWHVTVSGHEGYGTEVEVHAVLPRSRVRHGRLCRRRPPTGSGLADAQQHGCELRTLKRSTDL